MKTYSIFPQSSSITGTSPSDFLVSYPGHSLVGGSYPSAEKQSVYSIAPADVASALSEQSLLNDNYITCLPYSIVTLNEWGNGDPFYRSV